MKSVSGIIRLSVVYLFLATWAQAANTVSDGDWSVGAIWNTGNVPGAGETAVVDHNVTITNSTTVLTVTVNGTLTFTGWNTILNATTATVGAGGLITHEAQSDTSAPWIPDNRIYIACTDLTVDENGSIVADKKGYGGGISTSKNGYGPGGGVGDTQLGSGGYGGAGATVSGTLGATYGSVTAPINPGSGGGYYGSSVGGAGGGAVRIEAIGSVIVNGNIAANGEKGQGNNGNGGSGGSIYITCSTFSGNNVTLHAIGGASATFNGASGGGGRIAVVYTDISAQESMPVPSVQFSVAPGLFGNKGYGDIGTLYFPNNKFLTDTIIHSGQWMVSGFTNWSLSTLIISNAWIRFSEEDFSLTVTNDIKVLGGNVPFNRFDLKPSLISCGGDLILTNLIGVTDGAILHLLPSDSSVAAADGCGPRVDIGGTLSISSNSVLYPHSHPTNGTGIGFEMRDLLVAEGGSINANTLGYRGGTNATDHGYGAGGTLSASFSGGAGYGGAGGNAVSLGGGAYGSSNAPVHSGSGNGSSTWSGLVGGYGGGGLVRLVVDNRIILNGSISADGAFPFASGGWGGSSSGGGIYLHCREFAGNGKLSARGGNGGQYHGGGGGGGGRIAVWSAHNTSTLSVTNVAGGLGKTNPGQDGTIVFGNIPPIGTMLFIQ